jgi:ribonuclease BN (tRNA processing enzyme)
MVKRVRVLAVSLLVGATVPSMAAPIDECISPGLRVQVLGSGGESPFGNRALTSYVVWIDGKARLLVDVGPGAALRFAETSARASDVDAILLSQLQADHTSDLPAILAVARREERTRLLTIYGPMGDTSSPSALSTVTFVRTLFDGARGAYRHLGSLLNPMSSTGFKLEARDVRRRPSPIGARVQRTATETILPVHSSTAYRVTASYVSHGGYSALAWRVESNDRRIVFTGDTRGDANLERLAHNADLLIAHHAITDDASTAQRALYMPPSTIGRLANAARVKRLVLSHRTPATLGFEASTVTAIRAHYTGNVAFAEDLACYALP